MRLLLFPFAILYDLVTSVRNRLYDLGYKPSATFEIPLIAVGNLSLGGTGKTPMIEYLIRLLTPQYQLATLSRGYGRKTQGFRLAGPQENASTIGDEPFQLYRKFDGRFPVVVCEERALAVPGILDQFPETQVVLLDDAFQHRKVKAALTILLTDFNRPFYTDFVLPAGNLRESRHGSSRADIIVVTKCPEHIDDDQMMSIEQKIRRYSTRPVFFSRIRYGLPVAIRADRPIEGPVILLSGIATASDFEKYCRKHYHVVHHYDFADHHVFSTGELKKVCDKAKNENCVLLTTEKDSVRLETPELTSLLSEVPLFYLPIETEFIKSGKEFDEIVLNVVAAGV